MIVWYLDGNGTVTDKFSEKISVCCRCNASNTQGKQNLSSLNKTQFCLLYSE